MTGGTSLRSLFDLSGRVAVITGGSRGLGLQIAEALGEFGATVALVSRRQEQLDATAAGLREAGVEVSAHAHDMRDVESCEALTDRILAAHGRIDILVNNAGTNWVSPTADHPSDAWRKVMAVNVDSVFELTRSVARRCFLPAGKGAVVNIASIDGLLGHHPRLPASVAYNASKGAVISMTRALAAEWGPSGIRVNAIAPGHFPTTMTEKYLERHGDSVLADIPLGKLGNAGDLKGLALLLASDAGGHITGQTIVVDGGGSII